MEWFFEADLSTLHSFCDCTGRTVGKMKKRNRKKKKREVKKRTKEKKK